ncbi:glycoside hydrolase [Thozetella sp. PMI_491]|nr:glycoside hydrolase [Thozetella sp. PMI_491]
MWCGRHTRAAALAIALASFALPLQAAQDIDGNHIRVVGHGVGVDSPNTYYTKLHPCPKSCSTQKTPHDWTVFSSAKRLESCDQPMLVDFAVFNPLDNLATGTMVKACTLGDNANTTTNPFVFNVTAPARASSTLLRRDMITSPECTRIGENFLTDFDLRHSGTSSGTDATADILAILQGMQSTVQDAAFCNQSNLFGYSNGASVGLHIANMFGKATLVSLIENIMSEIQGGLSGSISAQLCNAGNSTVGGAVGISINTGTAAQSLVAVQKDVMLWAKGRCVSRADSTGTQLASVSVWENRQRTIVSTNTTRRLIRGRSDYRLRARDGDCTTTTVASGDSCGSLADKYNPASDFCSTLQPNQKVCCSAGSIPTPKENADGSCASYLVQSGDTCTSLALSNGLTVTQLEGFNEKKTWGWQGCDPLAGDINICLSDGTAPLPNPYDNAQCGPVLPGTTYPTDGTAISDLNPCPLNACCDVWGQCGITPEFCTVYKSPTGNPGYTPAGKAACVSNCDTNITNTGDAPSSYGRVGYWESWNFDRPCLNLQARHANTDGTYTIVHWAFATIDSSYQPQINDSYGQWDGFLGMSNVKRVISFGGWGYSTSPETYDVLREAMLPANRDAFSTNVVNFLNDNNLDGVDFDWEYPGALDIPGIPPGQAEDGPNYLKFLITLKRKLPAGKTLSIAAPASYWYLKAFPISEMSDSLDYIVYMTYDLHGQWDYGNDYSVDGCSSGNCLRSHVNLTETMQVLAMITKAGVPTNKIFVGESSYGRSFGMSDPSCTGPMCTFTGGYDDSTAEPGLCTQTAGYISNAEIYNLLQQGSGNAKTWYDTDSNSDIMTWDGNWVAFMSEATRSSRRNYWQGFNFAGTIDWAVDLQSFADEGISGDDDDDEDWLPPGDLGWGSCTASYSSIEALEADDSVPYYCASLYLLNLLQANLTTSMKSYDDLMANGYDEKFDEYASAVVDGASSEVDSFMRDNGEKYFSCIVTEDTWCCDKCGESGLDGGCTYCFDGDCYVILHYVTTGVAAPAEFLSFIKNVYKNYSEPCPPDYSQRGVSKQDPITATVYWTLEGDKSDQFWADLYDSTGISQDNIAFKDINHSSCQDGVSQQECRDMGEWDIGIPAPQGYDKSDVLNPKDTVSKAYGNLQNLLNGDLDTVIAQVADNTYGGSPADLVDALSLPIFMISDAIDGMNQVVKIADEIEKEKMEAIIFGFLTAIFFFIPVAGEIAGEVFGLAGIARIAALIGAAGNSAMDIYTIVDDPDNAPLAIFDLITEPLAVLDVAAIAKAAKIRRGMKDEDVEGLGKVKPKLDKVEKIKEKGYCTSKPKKKRDVLAKASIPHNAMSLAALNGHGDMMVGGMGSLEMVKMGM